MLFARSAADERPHLFAVVKAYIGNAYSVLRFLALADDARYHAVKVEFFVRTVAGLYENENFRVQFKIPFGLYFDAGFTEIEALGVKDGFFRKLDFYRLCYRESRVSPTFSFHAFLLIRGIEVLYGIY
jgi:hypothetical protein